MNLSNYQQCPTCGKNTLQRVITLRDVAPASYAFEMHRAPWVYAYPHPGELEYLTRNHL